MSAVLSDEWCAALVERLADLPPGPGGSGIVDIVVSGGEPARVTTRWVVEDGCLRSVRLDPAEDGAEVSIPATRAAVEAIVAGDVDPAVGFMRGDLKPEGSARAWLALLSALARDDCRDALGR